MKIRNRVKELRMVPAKELLANPKNWREHPKEQADAMREVLESVGFAGAVLARETPEGLMLIDGHLRKETAPDATVPVLVLDVTEKEADTILATFDPISAMATANGAGLKALVASLDLNTGALSAMLDETIAEAAKGLAGPITEDEAPAPLPDPVSKTGDLWLLGEHRLLCGDSTSKACASMVCASVPVGCFTSPPYAEQRKDTYGGTSPEKYNEWWNGIQAAVRSVLAPDGSLFVNIKPHCDAGQRHLYVFDLVTQMVRSWGWRFVEEYAWKHEGTPINPASGRFKNAFEPVYHFASGESVRIRPENVKHESDRVATWIPGRGNKTSTGNFGINGDVAPGLALPSNVVEVNKGVGRDDDAKHPAKFPTGLPSFFVRAFSDPGDAWYEPFSGSGTTIIAAEQLARKCYAIEIEPRYVDVAIRRWSKLTGKDAILEGGKKTFEQIAKARGVTIPPR